MAERCDDCVRGDFGTIKKLVFFIIALILSHGFLNGWSVYASSERDSEQDSRLATLETKSTGTTKELDRMNRNIEALIQVSNNFNILVQTHMARNGDIE